MGESTHSGEDHIWAHAEHLGDASGGDQNGLGKGSFTDPHKRELGSGELGRANHGRGFPMALKVKKLPANAGDIRDSGSVPGSG